MEKYLLKFAKPLVALGLAFAVVACTKEERVVQTQAPADITQSFAVSGNNLTLKKASLGKDFLLISSGTTGGATPQWLDVKPQVVHFVLDNSGKKLALNERNYQAVYSEIESTNLLATFNILSQDNDSITFDWGKGLPSLTIEGVFGTDVTDPKDKPDDDSAKQVIPVIDSYVQNLNFDSLNNLEINQISKVRTTAYKVVSDKPELQTREESLAMNLQIRPYDSDKPADNFVKVADVHRRVGFFVTKAANKKISASQVNLIAHWDLDVAKKGPITFRIPKSIPAKYKTAAAEGALYWNKVFGREIVVIEMDVDDHAAPKNRTIMLHWVPWLDSGAAYAQAQADPLTGEILRGQIFMPSVFTRVGSAVQLNLNGGNPVRKIQSSVLKPSLNGLSACDFSKSLAAIGKMALEADDSQRLRLAQDSVRSTIAHEAGHVFGLRHNFAGSFSAKVSTAEIYESARTYLKNLQHPGLETTTSIMDYVSGVDDVLASAYIKHSGLSYDVMAMTWAYGKDDSALNETISRYCTDEDIGFAKDKGFQIYGCERFDAGNNPLYRKFLDTKDSKNDFVKTLFVSIMGRLYPAPVDDDLQATTVDSDGRADLGSVLAATKQWVTMKTDDLDYVGQVLLQTSVDGVSKSKFISLENAKSHIVAADYAESDPYLAAKIAIDLKEAGGYSTLLTSLLRDGSGAIQTDWYARQLGDLEAAPYFLSGQTLSGRTYVLSSEERAQIMKLLTEFSSTNSKAVFVGVAKILPSVVDVKNEKVLKGSLVQQGEAAGLSILVKDLEKASTSTVSVKVGKNLAQILELPEKFYGSDEMLLTLGLLSVDALKNSEGTLSKFPLEQSLRQQLNLVILAADPEALAPDKNSTLTKEEYKTIIEKLKSEKTIDVMAYDYLTRELKVFSSL